MVSQSIMFIIAGFDTVQTCLTWTILELVKHPRIQEELIADVVKGVRREGVVNYSSVQDMKYLHCVVKGITNSLTSSSIVQMFHLDIRETQFTFHL